MDPANVPSRPNSSEIGIPAYIIAGGPAEDWFISGFNDGWEAAKAMVLLVPKPRPKNIVVAPWPHEAHARGVALGRSIPRTPPVPTNENPGSDKDVSFEDPLDPTNPAKYKVLAPIEQIYAQGFQRGWTFYAAQYLALVE